MDDKQVERILRGSWSPRPPDGMREKILHRARVEAERSWFGTNRWKLAFAGGWLVLVILGGAANRAQEDRVTAMVIGGKSADISVPVPRGLSEWKRSIEGFLAMASAAEDLGGDRTKGSDSL